MILDFKEIPKANAGNGLQDTFELFTRDFLAYLGYKIIQDPDRGPDGKKDLIVDEVIKGLMNEYTIRWLVSCKHFAHSGAAVKDTDEPNIKERLSQHLCDGFMGVYSTLSASSLTGILSGISKTCIFDHEKIERFLLQDKKGLKLAERYFPKSIANYKIENPVPADIFDRLEPIECELCHKNLLLPENSGNYICLQKEIFSDGNLPQDGAKIFDIVFACKEHDKSVCKRYERKGLSSSWEDLDDLCNPTIWICRLMAFVNDLFQNGMYPNAFAKMKMMFIRTYPYVARNLSQIEKEQVKILLSSGLMYDII